MPLSRWQPPVLRRDAEEAGRVTWLELFFDLVFVASLIQLGNALADDVSWHGVVRFGAIYLVLFWTWGGTTIFLNRIAVDDWQHRLLVAGQMFAVANMAIQTPAAFGERGAEFAASYVVARLLMVVMYLRASKKVPELVPMKRPYLGVFITGGALMALSIPLDGSVRPWVWAIAMGLEVLAFLSPQMTRVNRLVDLHMEHLQERFALFTIIVLGEGFVKTIDVLAEQGVTLVSQVYGLAMLGIAVSLWWTYFDDIADSHVLPADDGVPRPLFWMYLHLPLTGGITAFGVAQKKVVVLEGFGEALKTSYGLLLVGSLSLALVATAGIDAVTRAPHFAVRARERVGPRLIAAAALWLAWLGLRDGPALLLVGVVLVIMAAQILVEVLAAVKADRWVTERVEASLTTTEELCEHVQVLPRVTAAELACEGCLEEGESWVALRLCLTCGEVGCCDDSEGRHASGHFEETGHAVIRSIEPGDTWAWCYVDECTVQDWRTRTTVALSSND